MEVLSIGRGLAGLAVVPTVLATACGPTWADWFMVAIKADSGPNAHTGGPAGAQGVKWDYKTAKHHAYVQEDPETGQWEAACFFYNSEAWGRNPDSPPPGHGWCGLAEDPGNGYAGASAEVIFRTEYEGDDPDPEATVHVRLSWDFSAWAELPGSTGAGMAYMKADVEYRDGRYEALSETPEVIADVYPGDDPPYDYDEDSGDGAEVWDAEEGAVFTGCVRQLHEFGHSSELIDSFAGADVSDCSIDFDLEQ